MQLEHEFVVPVAVGQAWDVLLDVERIAPCLPGATVESFDGETANGRVKVKVGPIQVTYSGTAKFVEKDEGARRVTLDARGKEARGSGTAKATVVAVLLDQGDSTRVNVSTDLAITGKPAQFGRGVMVEVGNKLLGRFADCLADEIRGGSGVAEEPAVHAVTPPDVPSAGSGVGAVAGVSPPAGGTATPLPPQRPVRRLSDDEAIDLLEVGGAALVKRVAPVAVGLLLLFVLWRLLRRR